MTEKPEANTNENAAAPASHVERLVSVLRERLSLSNDADVSDSQILYATHGTPLRAFAEFHLACINLGLEIKKEIKTIVEAIKKIKYPQLSR